MLANMYGEMTSESRAASSVRALEESVCEILATQRTDGVDGKAVAAMEEILSAYPEIDAVACCADDVWFGAPGHCVRRA